MFARLLTVMIAATGVAVALLLFRQERLDTVHEMTTVHHRLVQHERTLWQLQAEIAARCRPEAIRTAVQSTNDLWKPVPERLRRSPVGPLQYDSLHDDDLETDGSGWRVPLADVKLGG